MLSACKSQEDKLNELIADATKSTLYIPESYDPVSTDCDSLFANYISETNINKSASFGKIMKEAKSLQRKVEFCKDLSWNTQHYESKLNKRLNEAQKIIEDIYNQLQESGEFIGFLADHKFRAKNNDGQVNFGEYIFILDKDKAHILSTFNGRNENVLYFFQLVSELEKQEEDNNISEIDLFEIADNIESKIELLYQ